MRRPLLAFALLIAVTPTASAAGNRYAVVTVTNGTADVTCNFEVRWGDGKWKKVGELQAGKALYFSVPLDANGKAPSFQLRLNRAIGNAKPLVKTFNLQWNAAAKANGASGKQYAIKRDLLDRNYVWVSEAGR